MLIYMLSKQLSANAHAPRVYIHEGDEWINAIRKYNV